MVSSLFDVTFLLHLLILFLLLAAMLCHMDIYIYMYNHWYYDYCHHSGYQCIYGLFLLLYYISLLPLSAFVLPFIVTLLFLLLLFIIIVIILYHYDDSCYFFNWLTLWYIKVFFYIINAFVFFVVIGHFPMYLWLIGCCFLCFFVMCLSAM